MRTVPKITLGLMSGTSADGVSIAAVSFKGRSFDLVGFQNYSYPTKLRLQVLNALDLKTPELASLHTELGYFFTKSTVQFLKENRLGPKKISVIGLHGQTVYHGPKDKYPITLQIGNPSVLAANINVPVVSDFRSLDVASGGEGAPLIPFFDKYFFGHGPCRALQNIGGIANVTLVGKGIPTVAFDTGPGNCLMDLVVERFTKGKIEFDQGGRFALRGHIDCEIARKMWAHPYFRLKPPKSTGRELFNWKFLQKYFGSQILRRPYDVLATLNFFTALSIFRGISRFSKQSPRDLIVSGGGSRNAVLMTHLRDFFYPLPVKTIEEYGIPTQAKEPLAFAFFALQRLQGKVNHLPETTGAKRVFSLGQLISPVTVLRLAQDSHRNSSLSANCYLRAAD